MVRDRVEKRYGVKAWGFRLGSEVVWVVVGCSVVGLFIAVLPLTTGNGV